MQDGEAKVGDLTPHQRAKEMDRAKRHLEYLLRLSEKDGKGDPAALDEARRAMVELKAHDFAAATLLTRMPGDAAFMLFNRARRALHALAPVVTMRLADKMDDSKSPGSTTVLLEVAKGIGLLTKEAPVSEGGREALITEKDVGDLSTDELRKRLLREVSDEED